MSSSSALPSLPEETGCEIFYHPLLELIRYWLTTSSPSALLSLPEEIWSKIFSYLTVDDRRRVRLTCHHFNEICDSFLVQESEHLVVRDNFRFRTVLQSLSTSRRRFRNITLRRVRLSVDDSVFFQKQGSHIRSLTFYKCEIEPAILKAIFEYCKIVRRVSLIYSIDSSGRNASLQKKMFDEFKSLQNDGIVCSNVTQLTFVLEYDRTHFLTNDKFLCFFAVFPNIKELAVKVNINEHFNEFGEVSSEIASTTKFTFSCVYDQVLRMRHQLRKLRLHFIPMKPDFTGSVQLWTKIALIEMKKLKVFSLNWPDLWGPWVSNPFLPLKHLTNLSCTIGTTILQNVSMSDFVRLLLNTATKLHFLSISVHPSSDNLPDFDLDEECFRAMLKSELRCLDFDRNPVNLNFDLLVSDISSLPPNRTLKYLNINIRHAPNRAAALTFVSYFHCLEHVKVKGVSQNPNIVIHKFRTDFRRFEICHNHIRRTGRWEREPALAIYDDDFQFDHDLRFDHLTHLCIFEDGCLHLAVCLLSKSSFPNLKSLILRNLMRMENDDLNIDLLSPVISKFTKLEYLEVNGEFSDTFDEWLASVKALQNLRYLFVTSCPSKSLKYSQYFSFFDVSPSLRLLESNVFVPISDSYRDEVTSCRLYKDILSNAVKRVYSFDKIFMFDGILRKYCTTFNKHSYY